jgi:hypothetical protein
MATVAINQGVGTTVLTRLNGSDNEQVVVAGTFLTRVQITPTINTAIYASGDELGTLQTITNAARFTGGGGFVRSITVLDKTQAQRSAIDVLFFDRSISVAGNNNAFAPSDADMANCLGVVAIATGDYNTAWAGTPTNSVATKLVVDFPFVCSATSLFALAVVRGTPTYTSTSDLIFSYTIEQS